MQIPSKISFHNMSPSSALESRILEKIEKLKHRCPRMIKCEVMVEASSAKKNNGNPFSVHIHVTLPGGEMVVSHHPGKMPIRHEDVYAAMNDGFKAIEKQIDHFKQMRRGHVKEHASVLLNGYVSKIDFGDEYGLITMDDGTEFYFHKNAVLGERFSELGLGSKVRFSFIEGEGHEGPQANFVRILKKKPTL